jgi:hypothetical protein
MELLGVYRLRAGHSVKKDKYIEHYFKRQGIIMIELSSQHLTRGRPTIELGASHNPLTFRSPRFLYLGFVSYIIALALVGAFLHLHPSFRFLKVYISSVLLLIPRPYLCLSNIRNLQHRHSSPFCFAPSLV